MKTNFKKGTIFRGNSNGALFEIVKIEKGNATIKCVHTGKCFVYGIKALEHCNITILESVAEDGKK